MISVLLLIGLLLTPYAIFQVLIWMEENREQRKDNDLLHNNPEAWKAKEQVKIERERLQVQKKYAEDESNRQNAGTLASIVRGFWR